MPLMLQQLLLRGTEKMEPTKLYSKQAIEKACCGNITREDLQEIAIEAFANYCVSGIEVISTADMQPNYKPFLRLKVNKSEVSIDKTYALLAYNPSMDRDHIYLWGYIHFFDLLKHIRKENKASFTFVVPSSSLRDPRKLLLS